MSLKNRQRSTAWIAYFFKKENARQNGLPSEVFHDAGHLLAQIVLLMILLLLLAPREVHRPGALLITAFEKISYC